MSVQLLTEKLKDLEKRLQSEAEKQAAASQKSAADLKTLSSKITGYGEEQQNANKIISSGGSNPFASRAAWIINDFDSQYDKTSKGHSMWSPEFSLCGISGIKLEFFPKGRETTTMEGFCALFLWCPTGTKIKYQLWVGKHLRAPDEDKYDGRMGHGHSNFCALTPELEPKEGGGHFVKVGVDVLSVETGPTVPEGLKLVPRMPESIVANEAETLRNEKVSRIEWKIPNISAKMKALPKGASMYSKSFTAGLMRSILLEFYPNGSENTTKEGYCALYIRGPEGATMTVTLFVGNFSKGPIKTTFDAGSSGKGLPDFCKLADEIDKQTDSLTLGITVKGDLPTTLHLT